MPQTANNFRYQIAIRPPSSALFYSPLDRTSLIVRQSPLSSRLCAVSSLSANDFDYNSDSPVVCRIFTPNAVTSEPSEQPVINPIVMLEQHSTEGWAKQHSTIAATALAFDWAEESMLTGHANGRISLWDLEYAKESSNVYRNSNNQHSSVERLEFYPSGEMFLSGDAIGAVKLWDSRRRNALYTFAELQGSPVSSIQFSPDGEWFLAVGGEQSRELMIWSLIANKMLWRHRQTGGLSINSAHFHPEDRSMVSYSSDRTANRLTVWDLMAAGDDGKPPHLCSTEWPTALVATSTAGKPFTCFYRDQSRLATAHSDSDEMDGESDRQQYGILTIESTGRQVFHRWNADDGKLELLQTAIADDNDGDGPIADALLCTGADMISTVSVGRQTASLSIKQQRVDLILASAVADRQQHQEDFSFPVTHRHEPSVLTDAFNMTKMTLAASGKSTDPFVLSSSGNSIQPNSTSTANCRRTQMSSQSTYSPATSLLPAKAAAVSTRSLAIIPEATGNIKLGLDLDHFVTSATALSVNFDDSGDRGFKFDDDRPPVKSAAESIPQTFQRIIKGRLEAMKAIQERWTDSNINDCLELLCRSLRDPAVLVDLLRVINKRPRMFTLDSCVLLFQTIPELLFDNSAAHLLFEDHVSTGCSTVRLLVEIFGETIRQHCHELHTGPGVDITREERVEKCKLAMQHAANCQRALLRLSENCGGGGKLALQVRSCLSELESRLLHTLK